MSSVVISGDSSGQVALTVPSTAGSNTITLPAVTGTAVIQGQNSAITASTAVASTSGTSITFSSIPSWVKRITLMFNGVSTSGTSNILVQIGSGSVTTTGYVSSALASSNNVSPAVTNSTSGFLLYNDNAGDIRSGTLTISNINTNNYVENHTMSSVAARAIVFMGGGTVSLSGALDRVVITTANGTDTFDAGSINILYE